VSIEANEVAALTAFDHSNIFHRASPD